ncbi:uncharacterized protein DUF4007 [Hydrogenispora ethanolica]|uniref:Uncharacterized protein DUF4007 n=1 Tax=Hydrogenispora ethanolica TaxID=1082276 RepID=A0A4R1QQN4_HYDET|nr:DUF4007 family protein [Hydrogenispora ethanolica]TCL55727.1 uncharacterized protein DUF4007 [Hydrogenispora ethanolica]
MRFRAHDTFFIRKGWLYKGMKHVVRDRTVFMGDNGNPMDILGMGANMVKSLRYWLQAVGLTAEPPQGKKYQTLTPFGEIVYENDRYIEEIGTLWFLHYKLATNEPDATAWYYFFNEFNRNEFIRDDFVKQLNTYIMLNGSEVSERSLDDDFNCIISTYVPRIKSNPGKVHPESNIDCPLGELSLVDIANKKTKTYKKSVPKLDGIHPLVVLAVIVDQAKGEDQIKISSIQNDKCNAGKVFNLDIITLISLLNKLELMGYIKVIRTAGLDYIDIERKIDFLGCVREYYVAINR